MRILLPVVAATALAPGLNFAQNPPAQLPPEIARPSLSLTLPKPAEPALMKFDPHATEVRLQSRRWQLWSGKTLLKDFGDNRDAAFQARRLIAELKLDSRGTVGTPEPVMEFWLAGGVAPPLPGISRTVVPFDPEKLRVLDADGEYKVADDRRILFDFGQHAADADRAIEIIRRYEFNEVGFIGEPAPAMTYLLKNPNPRRSPPPLSNQRGMPTLPQQVVRHAFELPGVGRVGDRRPFDPLRLELRQAGDGWRLASGLVDLGVAGANEYQARTAMQVMQRYPLTEHVRIGAGEFGFFLSHGQPPRGVPLGIKQVLFQPTSLTVTQAGNRWTLGDGRQTIAAFGNADDAKKAMAVVKHYRFNCACEVGRGLKFLALDR